MAETHSHGHPPGAQLPKYCPRCGQALALKNIKTGEPDRHVCTGCSEVFWLDPKLAVGTLIEWKGGLLVLKRGIEPGYGKWVFPGGFVDRGEPVPEAAAREAREEVCVEVGELEISGIFSYPGHPVVLITYAAKILSGTPAAGDEALDIDVFPLDAMPFEKLAFRSTVDAVREYLKKR